SSRSGARPMTRPCAKSTPAGSSRSSARSPSRSTTSMPVRPPTMHACWRRSMAIEIVKPGLSTSVQDLGRPGYYHLGIPVSGGMDRYALRVANLLVGNDEGAAVLEAVFMGPELRFSADAHVA